jgi:hypothetical protein
MGGMWGRSRSIPRLDLSPSQSLGWEGESGFEAEARQAQGLMCNGMAHHECLKAMWKQMGSDWELG